eukprot:TRINITY_DN8333_c0_g5_i1.p1 TRINITY_DN8333_c0_g5~~TRINITY_DN8333_c0_g5_i1.p1  ORF type:complete len:230 (+),score=79.37 TRINITY_DN8333_c0_g5_i1:95-784(+)
MHCCFSQEQEALEHESVSAALPKFDLLPSELELQVAELENLADPQLKELVNAAGNHMLIIDKTEGASLGVIVDTTDPKNLAVLKVSDGILKTAAEASKKDVKAGFRIVKVNGVSAAAKDMAAMLQEKEHLEIELEAFEEKKIKVEMGDKKLGVVVGWGTCGSWATINKIEGEGAIPDWNAAAAPEQKVMVSDKIVAIDGQRASPKEMVTWIKESPSMELTVYSWKSLRA